MKENTNEIHINSKYGEVVVYAATADRDVFSQISSVANSPLGENAHIRIMPDCHAGAGCVIGTTMKITDKVCPNLVGVDIGCGVDLVYTDITFEDRFEELDSVIRGKIPYGMNGHKDEVEYDFSDLLCWRYLSDDVKYRAKRALGSLGGGNHFIEAYHNGGLAVHSGSRHIGLSVAKYYQSLAERKIKEYNHSLIRERIKEVAPNQREKWLKENKVFTPRDLCFLTGEDMRNYLHDMEIIQGFANQNRFTMLNTIVTAMGGKITEHISSIHNYIDIENMILRKGAICADKGIKLVIPMNMRDGMLICEGKGNPEWNNSAPHGAGRLYSRSQAKTRFNVDEYRESMQGIFTTCVSEGTLDEAPFVYKDYREIVECIKPTVEILDRLIPIYNFKAD